MSDRHVDTAAVHAGRLVIPQNRASSPPLFQASSYEFDDLADVAAIYAGERPGAVYGRYGGPNASQFEAAMAELEGAEAAVGASAGMAAIDAAFATNVAAGDAIVATREIYGGSYALLENDYRRRGIDVRYVDQSDLGAVRAAVAAPEAKVLYVEALTNPLVHLANLAALAELAHAAGALLVVDATFVTPVLLRPLQLGADLVLHSVGKYLGGHGDVGAGVLAGRAGLIANARAYLVRTGATMPHFEAWLALRGLRTLALRMERHSANAVEVAAYLAASSDVRTVHHPSLPDHPQHELAARTCPRGTGGIVAFDLASGDARDVDRFLRGLGTIAIVHSLGEVATTISYPAVSSHRPLPPPERRALGVGDATLRLSVGIESARDIVADLSHAFEGLREPLRA
ncbi:MAG: O-succinylhomoserine sulfhydrylase [Vulcanimicrobiaceae bacterium]